MLFGLHIATHHSATPVPEPAPDRCTACQDFELYLTVEGPDIELAHLTGCITSAELAAQHRLSHLIDLMPDLDVA